MTDKKPWPLAARRKIERLEAGSITALAHRTCNKYEHRAFGYEMSSRSEACYTFNETTLLDFSRKVREL